jgi:hypothetical protein
MVIVMLRIMTVTMMVMIPVTMMMVITMIMVMTMIFIKKITTKNHQIFSIGMAEISH